MAALVVLKKVNVFLLFALAAQRLTTRRCSSFPPGKSA